MQLLKKSLSLSLLIEKQSAVLIANQKPYILSLPQPYWKFENQCTVFILKIVCLLNHYFLALHLLHIYVCFLAST